MNNTEKITYLLSDKSIQLDILRDILDQAQAMIEIDPDYNVAKHIIDKSNKELLNLDISDIIDAIYSVAPELDEWSDT